MILSVKNFNNRLLTLEEIISIKEESLKNVPEGNLQISLIGGKPRFFLAINGDKHRRYLSEKDKSLICELAQKRYDEMVLASAREEVKLLTPLINIYQSGIAEDIYNLLRPERQQLIKPILMPEDEFVKKWLAQPYEKLGFDIGAPEFYTDKRLRVRSKTEIGIANKYDTIGIPMLYEKPIFLKGWGRVWPDFTLLNVRLRKEYAHEHLGMMDDPEYAKDNVAKIHAYEKNGYFPGKNLILTFETKDNPFDTKIIEDIAKQYLL